MSTDKRTKRQTKIYKTLHRKLKIEHNEPNTKCGDELRWSGRAGREGQAVHASLVAVVVLILNDTNIE